jgi:hypothetical protein
VSVDPETALERLRITAQGARRLRMRITPVVVDELAAVIDIIDNHRAGSAEDERNREYRRKRATRRFDKLLDQRRELLDKLTEARALVDEMLDVLTDGCGCVLDLSTIEDWQKRAVQTETTITVSPAADRR